MLVELPPKENNTFMNTSFW